MELTVAVLPYARFSLELVVVVVVLVVSVLVLEEVLVFVEELVVVEAEPYTSNSYRENP